MISRLLASLAAGTCLAAVLTSPAAAATQTYVSGVGDDVNPCSRSLPCKTFAGAISKTEPGGVIHVLDPGGYGSVTITKSITIDASGTLGSVIMSASGVVINAPANADVTLRGLDLFSGQVVNPTCGPNQQAGVRVLSARTVTIEDTRINLAATGGVQVTPSVNPATVNIVDSVIRNSCGPAVRVAPTAGVSAHAEIVDSTLSLNAVGIMAESGGTVRLRGSTLFGNGAATTNTGGSIDLSDPSNRVIANTAIANPRIVTGIGGATRTWVAGDGNDANPCSRTAPCKTVAGAFSKTFTGGQINVLNQVAMGTVTMNRPMTIDGHGSDAAISVPSGSGITVDLAAVEAAVIRDVRITGLNNGAAGCAYPATSGIRVLNGRSVHIENSTISGFGTAGVDVTPTSSSPRILMDKTVVSNTCGSAVRVAPAGGQTVQTLINRSSLVSNGTAVSSAEGSTTWMSRSYLANNAAATAGAGSVTVLPDTVEVVKEITKEVIKEVPIPVTPVAQTPVSCKRLPAKLRAKKTTVVLANTCVTTGGQRVTLRISGAGKAVKSANGRVSVRTKKKGKVTLTLSAPATPAFLAFQTAKTYRL